MLDRVACYLGIWALRRLYGADCETDVEEDWPGEGMVCLSCDARRLVVSMSELLGDE
jgi:hypothetical protein